MSKLRHDSELADERDYVTFLYATLDAERSAARTELATALADHSGEPWLREVTVTALSDRLSRSRIADQGLCFGRLRTTGDELSYVGRIGLLDDEYRPLLIDWRAPAARPFYCATAARPEGVAVRRHFRTRGRTVVDFHDDDLDSRTPNALLAAVNTPRGETMRDIVATIRAEQDDVIRQPHQGVLLIEGGPGTGKTAVALHRVAYLLYTQRERLSRRGVLVVGPGAGFLRHIDQVLPSLGETDVVFATTGDLLPGRHVTAADTAEAKRVKGGIAMVEVLTAAIADREELPAEPVAIELADVTVRLDRRVAETARERARVTRLRHNEALPVFVAAVCDALATLAVDRITEGWLRPGEAPDLRAELTEDVLAELRAHPVLVAELAILWPRLTPDRLLADLYPTPDRIDAAAAMLPAADRGRSLPARRRRLDHVGRAAAGRGRRAVGPRSGTGPQANGGARVRQGRAPGAGHRRGPGRRVAAGGGPAGRGQPGRAVHRARRQDGRRARLGGPRVDVRARRGRRGAGAIRNGLAGVGSPVSEPVVHHRG